MVLTLWWLLKWCNCHVYSIAPSSLFLDSFFILQFNLLHFFVLLLPLCICEASSSFVHCLLQMCLLFFFFLLLCKRCCKLFFLISILDGLPVCVSLLLNNGRQNQDLNSLGPPPLPPIYTFSFFSYSDWMVSADDFKVNGLEFEYGRGNLTLVK